jgi:predicted dehydrogenase
VLIPAFKAAGAVLKTVASNSGVSGVHAGRKFGFEATTTATDSVFADASVNTVVVSTRHDSHARLAVQGLGAGKHVFVEKPLALTLHELDEIDAAYRQANSPGRGDGERLLMVGFNRRFAPHVQKMHALLAGVRDPKVFVMTVNAGAIPAEHWTQDRLVGGGRIIGEGCHFIDLLRHLAGTTIDDFQVTSMRNISGVSDDKSVITLRFSDGSIGTILYLANGHKTFPKERLDVFAGGRTLQLNNFRTLRGFGWPGFTSMKLWRQDKGQRACAAAFVQAVTSGTTAPIPYAELMEVSRVSIEVAEALR